MSQLDALRSLVFWSIPFFLILSYFFKLIKLLCTLITDKLLYPAQLLQYYLLILFYSMFVKGSLILISDFNPVPLLVVSCILILAYTFYQVYLHGKSDTPGFYRDLAYESFGKYLTVLAFVSVPAFLLVYFGNVFFLYSWIGWYNNVIHWLMSIPVVGSVIRFLIRFVFGGIIFSIVIGVLVLLIKGIGRLRYRNAQAGGVPASNSAEAPQPVSVPAVSAPSNSAQRAASSTISEKPPIRCPRCGLINPGNAVRCDCGYEFHINL